MAKSIFDEAREAGIIRPGFVGTAEDIRTALADLEEQRFEAQQMRREADYWDNGGPHREIIWWENEQDRLREQMPF
jgi:hypothetical protein